MAEGKKSLKLGQKIGLALGFFRVAVGEVKGQRGQRVEHPELAHIAPVNRLHTQNTHHDGRRHAVLRFGARQRGGVRAHEGSTRFYALWRDHPRPVSSPVAAAGQRRRRHGADHAGQKAGLRKGLAHPGRVELPGLGNRLGGPHSGRVLSIGDRLRCFAFLRTLLGDFWGWRFSFV